MKKTELNDEMLTAYALGELDARETAAVEAAIDDAAAQGNNGPREAVTEIRTIANLSAQALATSSAAREGIGVEARHEVEAAAAGQHGITFLQPRLRVSWVVGALAAALVLGVFGLRQLEAPCSGDSTTQIARVDPAQEAEKQYRMFQRNGIDRFFITDINGPGRSVIPDPDFDDPAVQKRIREVAEIATPSMAPEMTIRAISNGQSLTNRRIGLEHSLPQNKPTSPASTVGNEKDKKEPGRKTDDAQFANRPVDGFAALAPKEREQLRSLGYLRSDAPGVAAVSPQVGRYAPMPAPEVLPPTPPVTPGSESYDRFADNEFTLVTHEPLSTFSIDVDTASYANMRRFITQGQVPPRDAVRVEEWINYFDYAYPRPTGDDPFAASMEVAECPWTPGHRLVRIGLQGKEISKQDRPPTNLVFLLDVSGSMQASNKLPLVKRGMEMLVRELDARDRVAIVTYASGSGVALPSTSAVRQDTILGAIGRLRAGGSTNGAAGIRDAYRIARENFLRDGVNRVILATDGDFNVGTTGRGALEELIQREAKSGVFLTVLGFGMGNIKDDTLEMLSNKGNGAYAYIDGEPEARKVFLEEMTGTLVTIAKDVKIQVEFNPGRVSAYRLIGYENRALAAEDFNDDHKDAGEIGAGHTVTALYEIVPAGMAVPTRGVDPLRYRTQPEPARVIAPAPAVSNEMLLLKVRYKEPDGTRSRLLEFPLRDSGMRFAQASHDFKFASGVAAFGRLFRGNPLGNDISYDALLETVQDAASRADDPRKAEFVQLMQQARPLLDVQPQAALGDAAPMGGLRLIRIREAQPGEYTAQIETASGTGWYSPGDTVDRYPLVAIDSTTHCVTIAVNGSDVLHTLCL